MYENSTRNEKYNTNNSIRVVKKPYDANNSITRIYNNASR